MNILIAALWNTITLREIAALSTSAAAILITVSDVEVWLKAIAAGMAILIALATYRKTHLEAKRISKDVELKEIEIALKRKTLNKREHDQNLQ